MATYRKPLIDNNGDHIIPAMTGDQTKWVKTGDLDDESVTIAKIAMQGIFNAIYPVGHIYMSVNNTNPSTLFGGTWVAWGSGRVPVGVDTTQTEFDTVEETGGEKTHTLSTNEMPQHSHGAYYTGSSSLTKSYGWYGTSGNAMAYDIINAGGNQAHNNLQPYITCYMWKRVS